MQITIDLDPGEIVELTVANLSVTEEEDPDPEPDEAPEEVKPASVRAIGGKAA